MGGATFPMATQQKYADQLFQISYPRMSMEDHFGAMQAQQRLIEANKKPEVVMMFKAGDEVEIINSCGSGTIIGEKFKLILQPPDFNGNKENKLFAGKCSCQDSWKLIKSKGDNKMMDSLKQYVTKHRDIFFTIGFILVLDHFVFGGAFKKKLEDFIHSILDRQIKTAKVVDGQ